VALNKVFVVVQEYDGDVEIVGVTDDEDYADSAVNILRALEMQKLTYKVAADYMRIQGI